MDIAKFRKRIQTTILLTEEQKAYFLSRTKTYTPKVRTQIIDALNKHEKNLLDKSDKILQKIQEEQSSEALKYASISETVHNQEVEQANKELEVSLKQIEAKEIRKRQKAKPQIEPEKKKPKTFNKVVISLIILIVLMLSFFALKSNWNFPQEDSQSTQSQNQN